MENTSELSSSRPQAGPQLQNSQLFLLAGSLGFVLVLIRLGPFSFILIIFTAFTLCALPEFRQIVDGFIGNSLSAQQRLKDSFPRSVEQNLSELNQSKPGSIQKNLTTEINLDVVPKPLVEAFGQIFELIIRDFVGSWYNLPSVSTGDPEFLRQVRLVLDHVLMKVYIKISTKSSKETLIYLIGCLSMNLVRELNDLSNRSCTKSRSAQRTSQTRRISQEILLTLGPPSVTLSSLPLTLLSEILTVQIVSTTNSFDGDWFNSFIIQTLGSSPSSQVPSEIVEPLEVLYSNQAFSGSQQNIESIGLTGNDVISFYLKNFSNFGSSSSTDSLADFIPDQLKDLFEKTPTWKSDLKLDEFTLKDLLSVENITGPGCLIKPDDMIDPERENLVRIWNQLDSFRRISHLSDLDRATVKSDAISLLSALVMFMNQTMDRFVEREKSQEKKDLLSSKWKSVAVETLRRLESPTLNGQTLFANLQEWIVELLYSSQNVSTQSDVRGGEAFKAISTEKQTKDTSNISRITNGDEIRTMLMAMPSVPPASQSSREPPSYDLGDPHPPPLDKSLKANNPKVNQAQSRDRSASFTRTAASPPDSEMGASPPRQSFTMKEVNDPIKQMNHADSRISPTTSRLAYHIPEDGDLTDDYSFDELNESGDMGTSVLDKPSRDRMPSVSSSKGSSRPGSRRQSNAEPSSLTPNRSSSGRPSPPTSVTRPHFTVTVTDMSSSSAFDPKTGLIKQKKEIEIMIAIESQLVSGFIVTRKWTEFEKLDSELNKLKLVGIGTKAFPRALLPSHLNFKTIDHLLRESQAYLDCLLNNDKYFQSEPVRKFFAKERSGSSSNGPILNLFNSTQSTLDSIGKGVANVGKEVVNKPVDLAAQGFNRLSKGVLRGLSLSGPSTQRIEDQVEVIQKSIDEERREAQNNQHSTIKDLKTERRSTESVSEISEDLIKRHSENFVSNITPEKQKDSPLEWEGSVEMDLSNTTVEEFRPDPSREISSRNAEDLEQSNAIENLPAEPKRIVEVENVFEKPIKPINLQPKEPKPNSSGRTTVMNSVESSEFSTFTFQSSPSKKNTQPIADQSQTVKLNEQEFDAVIVGMMSVLEAAYGLESNGSISSGWSMRRGVLRILETVLRTTSWNGLIRKSIGDGLSRVSNVESVASIVGDVRESLWPGGVWFSEARSEREEIERRKRKEKKDEDLEEERRRRKDEAKKLFLDSWASLKIGLGSNATEAAASKVFEVFQDGGCEVIIHALIIDVIRILLLL
ncbi:hypothetical protein PPACK8108_LOCUS7859 [Phakopsora pachyrhizi]|uniref:PXA domain-containing protein n=1 Tax=Phakopsora pachyrhizi TaxID=170000 RepID=A0AAV0ATS9_PHAPC|nr:hypothetical protein PPACK8108_LOCUS7859 [Phakopsora pachyrhizi]